MNPSIAQVISRRAIDIDITRRTGTGGFDASGYPVIDDTVINIRGHIQPMSPEELQNLPAGQNSLGWVVVWTLDDVEIADRITDPDTGRNYRVEKVEFWRETPHWEARAVRTDDDLNN